MKSHASKRPKGPARYVPTLTEVVPETLLAPVPMASRGSSQADGATEDLPQQCPGSMEKTAAPVLANADVQSDSQQPAAAAVSVVAQARQPDNAFEAVAGLHQAGHSTPSEPLAQKATVSSGQTAEADLLSPGLLEEAMVHRVMQRVDIGLDQRLRDAIATVVLEQTRSLLPRLREEVESVLRQVVCEAVADEVATKAGGTLRKS